MEGAYSSEVLVTSSRVHGVVTEKNTRLIDTVLITSYDLLSEFYCFDVLIIRGIKLQYN